MRFASARDRRGASVVLTKVKSMSVVCGVRVSQQRGVPVSIRQTVCRLIRQNSFTAVQRGLVRMDGVGRLGVVMF